MAEEQVTTAAETAPETAPEVVADAVEAADASVTDVQTYAEKVKADMASGSKDKPKEPEDKLKSKEPPAAETPLEPPVVEDKIAALRKKVDAERAKRGAELETKRQVSELEKHRPLLQGLESNKVGTVDSMLSVEEFEKLCDIRIARLQGQPEPGKVSDVEQRMEKKLKDLESQEMSVAITRGKANYSKLVLSVSEKHPDFETACDWLTEKGYDFGDTCVETAEEIRARDGNIPPPEQARDAVIAYVMGELATAEKVKSKRKPKESAEEKTEETKKAKKTLNSTIKGTVSKSPEVLVTGHESYAEMLKANLRASK